MLSILVSRTRITAEKKKNGSSCKVIHKNVYIFVSVQITASACCGTGVEEVHTIYLTHW